METVDVTPTWPAAAQILLAALEHGNGEGKRIAKEEIMRMAEIAQKYVDLQKQNTTSLRLTGSTLRTWRARQLKK